MDPRLLLYVVISHPFSKQCEAEMYGAGSQKRVPESFVLDYRCAVPPSKPDAPSAAHLDRETAKIDLLMAKKREQIEKLKAQRSALTRLTEYRAALITAVVTGQIDVR